MGTPEEQAGFYTEKKLGFDLKLVERSFLQFKNHFVGSNVLELGPATGYMTKHLVKHFENVVAIEGSVSLYNQIPNYTNLTKINSLFEDYETDEKFETIILNHVLEHIEEPIKLLTKIKGWLSNNGILIVGVPNAKSFHRLAAVKMGLLKTEYELNDRDIELGHYRVYDFETLSEHVSKAGYDIKQKGGVFLKFLSNMQIEEYLNESIVNAYFELASEFIYNSAEIYMVLMKANCDD